MSALKILTEQNGTWSMWGLQTNCENIRSNEHLLGYSWQNKAANEVKQATVIVIITYINIIKLMFNEETYYIFDVKTVKK